MVADSSAVSGLTRREREVLALMAQGFITKQIAERLCVSQETVSTHVTNLRRKLGARNKAHAVALGFQLGILSAAQLTSAVGDTRVRPHSRQL